MCKRVSPDGSNKVFANSTYQYVHRGQPLFTIYSPDLVSTENEYLLAIDARKRVSDSSVADVTTDASSLVDSAAERLKLWGVSPREIARLERERTVRHAVEIDSPMSGYIVERNALPNMYVQPDTRLFTITDLSKVWIYAAVFQDEIGKVRPGDPATVTVDAYPGTNFDGRVDFIQPQIDPMTRTARVRCEFNNPKGQLLPGMFAHVALDLPMGEQTVIPGHRGSCARARTTSPSSIAVTVISLLPRSNWDRTSAMNSSCSRDSRRVSRSSAPPIS